ncbi:MAG: YfhO family protein [Ignavibacteriales bacterium]|nr:YfhO family protein [Ignavibacteriales bacterium]
MSKTKKQIGQTKLNKETVLTKFDFDKLIPPKYQTLASLGILLILFLIFFSPLYFGGKTFQSGDIVTSKSMVNYVEKHGDGYTLWNPYIFCGMPAHAISVGYKWFNLIYVGATTLRTALTGFFANDYTMWTFYLMLLALTSFLFIKYKTGSNLISLFAAVATTFSTGLIVFLFIGHVTKLTALCMYPLMFLMLFKFQNKIKLLDVAILTVALQLFVQGWHVQIIFYTLLSVGIYFLYYIIRSIATKEKELTTQLFKSVGVFAVAAVIALLIQADNFTQIWNYTPYSTRGTKSISELQTPDKKQSESDFYQYATNWSFSPGEVLTFIIPSYYGFGNSTYKGPLTNNQEYKVNTYFGQMMFVDVAMYMGVIVFFLALFAVFTRWKDPFVQFLTILSVFALLVSFGRTFSPVFDLMFYYFPYFEKFRVPSMILVLVQLSLPMLAALGIQKIVSLKTEKDLRAEKIVRYSAFAFTGLFVISLVLNSALKDMFASRIIDSQKNPDYMKALSEYASEMFLGDVLVAFALTSLTFWLAYGYITSKLSKDILVSGIILFTIFDLWRIDSRGAEYVNYKDMQASFKEPDYITIIKKQNDKSPYRILNLKQDQSLGSLNQNSNYHAYFLQQDLYGYSGIKPRAYQDIVDVLGGAPVSLTLWKMLNVKYIITEKPIAFPGLSFVDSTYRNIVYRTDGVLPRAYFVNRIETKPMVEVLNAIKNNLFDPKDVAFMEEGNLKVDKPDSTALVNIIDYKDELIKIEAKATGNNFLFLGDTYYPNGWKAYVDGKEMEIYKVNHGFRGIIVPKGQHQVEFIYAPKSFYISKYIALSLSSLVIIGLAFGLFLEFRKKKV